MLEIAGKEMRCSGADSRAQYRLAFVEHLYGRGDRLAYRSRGTHADAFSLSTFAMSSATPGAIIPSRFR